MGGTVRDTGSGGPAHGAPAPSARLTYPVEKSFLAQGWLTPKAFYDGRASIHALSSLRTVAICFANSPSTPTSLGTVPLGLPGVETGIVDGNS